MPKTLFLGATSFSPGAPGTSWCQQAHCTDVKTEAGPGAAGKPQALPGPPRALHAPFSRHCSLSAQNSGFESVSRPGGSSALLIFAPPAPGQGQRCWRREGQDRKRENKARERGGRRKSRRDQPSEARCGALRAGRAGWRGTALGRSRQETVPLQNEPLSQCWLKIVPFPRGLCIHTGSPVDLGPEGQFRLLCVLPRCPSGPECSILHLVCPLPGALGPLTLSQRHPVYPPVNSQSRWGLPEGLGPDLHLSLPA